MRILQPKLLLIVAMLLGQSACSTSSKYVPSFVKPYRFDIQQGNFVTEQDTSRLRKGMSKDQVRFILGTPLVNDAFHADRWDYLYRLTKGNGQVSQARYTVIFENGELARFGGENLPKDQSELFGATKSETGIIQPREAEKIDSTNNIGGTENSLPVVK